MTIRHAAAALLLCFLAAPAAAQTYPAKPVRLIVPDAPGTAADIGARRIAPKLAEALGQPVVIDNRPGGNMVIGSEAAARAPADGHTLFMGNNVTHALNALTIKNLNYRPEDLIPVTAVSKGPLILVTGAHVPAKTLRELLDLARSQPNQLTYGSLGRGTPAYLLMEQLKQA